MNEPFKPLSEDGISRWKKMYPVLKEAKVGDVVSYGVLGKAAGMEDVTKEQRMAIQSTASRAIKELLEVDKHAVVAVYGTGYRIVEAHEHLALAQTQQAKSRRSIRNARRVIQHTDRSLLTKQMDSAFETADTALALQERFARQTDIRRPAAELAGAISDAQKRIWGKKEPPEKTADELAEIRQRLADLHQRVGEITAE